MLTKSLRRATRDRRISALNAGSVRLRHLPHLAQRRASRKEPTPCPPPTPPRWSAPRSQFQS